RPSSSFGPRAVRLDSSGSAISSLLRSATVSSANQHFSSAGGWVVWASDVREPLAPRLGHLRVANVEVHQAAQLGKCFDGGIGQVHIAEGQVLQILENRQALGGAVVQVRVG